MKKVVIFIGNVLIASMIMISCNKNNGNEQYYEAFGVVHEDVAAGGKMYITSDKGNIIIPLNSTLSLNDKGSRIWMLFTVDNTAKTDTIKAYVYELLKITKVEVQTEGLDNLKNDKIFEMGTPWIKQGFLTLNMLIYAYAPSSLEQHKYNFYLNPATVSDTIYMELRYDNNNDHYNRGYNKLLTVPMSRIYQAAGKEQASVLSIKYMHTDGPKTVNVKINTE